MSLLVGRCLPGRRRECRGELQSPVPEGQPPHAALTQSGCERRSQDQRKHLRNRVSPLGPAPGTQSSHRSHCPSTVPADLVDPASRSPLRRTGPSGHQAVKAKAHGENDPATPKPRLSDRNTQSSTQPSTSAVIFEPAALRICSAPKPSALRLEKRHGKFLSMSLPFLRHYRPFARLAQRLRLRSGSCTLARVFAPRFLQTPPRSDALALCYHFTSIRL
jgi:hypothetical protein